MSILEIDRDLTNLFLFGPKTLGISVVFLVKSFNWAQAKPTGKRARKLPFFCPKQGKIQNCMGKCLQCTHLSQATGNSPCPVAHSRARVFGVVIVRRKCTLFFLFFRVWRSQLVILKLVPRFPLTFKFPLDYGDWVRMHEEVHVCTKVKTAHGSEKEEQVLQLLLNQILICWPLHLGFSSCPSSCLFPITNKVKTI